LVRITRKIKAYMQVRRQTRLYLERETSIYSPYLSSQDQTTLIARRQGCACADCWAGRRGRKCRTPPGCRHPSKRMTLQPNPVRYKEEKYTLILSVYASTVYSLVVYNTFTSMGRSCYLCYFGPSFITLQAHLYNYLYHFLQQVMKHHHRKVRRKNVENGRSKLSTDFYYFNNGWGA